MPDTFPGQRLPRWENAPHVLQTQQFDRVFIDSLFGFTDQLIHEYRNRDDLWVRHIGKRRVLLSLMYEATTRTRATFLCAAMNLGIRTIDIADPQRTSSEVKGESFADSIRIYAGGNDHTYRIADVIVVRHREPERVFEAAQVSRVPIINAGNGPDQHPTQSLVDLYAIRRELGRLDGLHVGIVGDLRNGRTCRSLAYLLGKVGKQVNFTFISHPDLRMREDVCDYLRRHNVPFAERADYGEVLPTLDVLYVVRLQTERDPEQRADFARELVPLRVTPEVVRQLKPPARILHPLPVDSSVPEVSEIHPDLCAAARDKNYKEAQDPRLAWFRQADLGVPVRMALLVAVLQLW